MVDKISFALVERHRAAIKAAAADLRQASSAIEQAQQHLAKCRAELQRFIAKGPTMKKKTGRPGFWRGHGGFSFASEVDQIRAEHRCGIAQAIAKALKDPLNAHLRKHSARQLQRRYQEARSYWAFTLDPYGFAGSIYRLETRIGKAESDYEAAVKQHHAVQERLSRLMATVGNAVA
jgi:uncharacterized protein YukE